MFKVVHEVITALQEQSGLHLQAMKLNLQAAQAINAVSNYTELEELAYEFVSQSMLIY